MNDQQILTLIAKKPGIVAIQIADALDVELAEASAALKELVEIGHIQRSAGTAPNGLPAQVYHLTEDFKRTNEYRAVMAIVEADGAHSAPPAAAPTPAPVASQQPVAPTPSPTPPVGRMERAIAFIRAHGPVNDVQLRAELGMKQEEYPSSILSPAVKEGRVVRVGSEWVLGDGTPSAPVKRQTSFGGPLGLAGSTPGAPQVPSFLSGSIDAPPKPNGGAGKSKRAPATVVDQRTQPSKLADQVGGETMVAEAAAAGPRFRCGLWSDGVLELQRDGVQVAALTQREGEALADFIARMRQPLDQAA